MEATRCSQMFVAELPHTLDMPYQFPATLKSKASSFLFSEPAVQLLGSALLPRSMTKASNAGHCVERMWSSTLSAGCQVLSVFLISFS